MNVNDLDEFFPGLAAELSDEKLNSLPRTLGADEIKIEETSSGQKTMLIKGVYLHSPRDPLHEAKRLAQTALNEIQDENIPLLIMGFGLGYSAEAATMISPKRPVVIVEKHPEILWAAVEARDLKKLLSENRIVFALGDDQDAARSALALFENTLNGGFPPCIKNRALINLDAEWYAAVESGIKTWLPRKDVNKATLKHFGKRWMKNLSHNLPAIRDRPGILALGGMLNTNKSNENKIPVFLAAAGPGLDCVSEILPEIKKRCITIAVDTSLRFFLRRGVAPDFAVSVDPQYWNFRHLDRLPAPETWLISESAVYPSCLRHPFRGIFLCSSFFPAGKFVEDRVDVKGELGAGGSVATSAWDFARLLGANEIWIAGLDLSFPGNKTHFRGALFEDRSLAESGRFSPPETWSFRALRDGQPFPAKNCNGGTVMTDKRLSLYALWFGSRFANYPHVKNKSLSGEGLAINGLEVSSPEMILELPDRRREIDALLENTFSAAADNFSGGKSANDRSVKYRNALNEFTSGLRELGKIASEAAETAEKSAHKNRQGFLSSAEKEKALASLDKALVLLNKSNVREPAAFLFPEMDANHGSGSGDSFQIHVEYLSGFYRALEETVRLNLELFEDYK